MSQENDGNDEKTESIRKFEVQTKYDSLYDKHGLLWQYGDNFIDSLDQKQQDILEHASTLMCIHPVVKHKKSRDYFVSNYKFMKAYQDQGENYYLVIDSISSSDSEFCLLDKHFRPLYHRDARLFLAKILCLYKAGVENTEVTVDKADRLAVYNLNQRTIQIYDGTGTLLLDRKFDGYAEVEDIDGQYFLVREPSGKQQSFSSFLCHVNTGIIREFPYEMRVISKSPLHIGQYKYGKLKSVFDIAKGCEIIPEHEDIKLDGSLYICRVRKHNSSSHYSSCKPEFTIRTLEENILFKYEDKPQDYWTSAAFKKIMYCIFP